jgi:quercetin dioxygenase-like cupin family protein
MDQDSRAKTPGAKRAGPGEHHFELAKLARVKAAQIKGGPTYSTAVGACIEGDRMMVAMMRMPAGTGAEPHSHPNEQWIYILEGTFEMDVGGNKVTAGPGSVLYIPSNVVHSGRVTPDADVVFFTVKDTSHSLQGVKAA